MINPITTAQRLAFWQVSEHKTVIRSTAPAITPNCCYLLVFCRLSLHTIVSIEFQCHCLSGCAVAYFFSEGEEIFLIQFCLRGKGRRSFARFGLCLGLCSLQMCLHQCVGYFSLYFSLIIFCKSLGLNETAHFHFPNPPCSLTALHHSLR